MNFLIGNIEPNNPNEPDFAKEPNSGDVSVTPNETIQPEVKKTNWVLYGLLGLVAISIILGNKK